MKKNVMISFAGTQKIDGDEEKVEFMTEGSFYTKNNGYYVTYDESELTGLEGTTTMLKVHGNKVTMLRFGSNNTQLIFEKGRRHVSCYDTSYGIISVGVWSDNVTVDIDENGGEIFADYNIDVDNNTIGKNSFRMQISER